MHENATLLDWNRLRDEIKKHYKKGDRVVHYTAMEGAYPKSKPKKEEFEFVKVDDVHAHVVTTDRRKRPMMIGIANFYCWVDGPMNSSLTANDLSPCRWLLTGCDGEAPGVRHVDVLAYLWAVNDKLIPRDDTVEGKRLRSLIEQSNRELGNNNSVDKVKAAYELIDSYLFRHNTYLDALLKLRDSKVSTLR